MKKCITCSNVFEEKLVTEIRCKKCAVQYGQTGYHQDLSGHLNQQKMKAELEVQEKIKLEAALKLLLQQEAEKVKLETKADKK